MGRACMDLWTSIHFVLKTVVVALMIIVEFLVFDWTTKQYTRFVYLEGYYIIVLAHLIIVLYGYTWFDVSPILEILVVVSSTLMLIFTIVSYIKDYNSKYVVGKREQEQFLIFVILTIVGGVLLIIDMIFLILGALGKGPSFAKRAGGGE
nr:uncharacterized protein LOC116429196 [Nomia melanderi]